MWYSVATRRQTPPYIPDCLATTWVCAAGPIFCGNSTQGQLKILSGRNKQPWLSVSDSRNRWCSSLEIREVISHRATTRPPGELQRPAHQILVWTNMTELVDVIVWLVFLHPHVVKHWHGRMGGMTWQLRLVHHYKKRQSAVLYSLCIRTLWYVPPTPHCMRK